MRGPAVALAATAVAAAVAAAVLVAAPRPADACSSGCSGPAYFVPEDGATVPANLPAITWHPRGDNESPNPSQVTLTTAADPGTPLAFTASRLPDGRDFLLRPDAPLVAGTQYVLRDVTSCSPGDPTRMVTFTAGPIAPLPTALGPLVANDLPAREEEIATTGGSCFLDVITISAEVLTDQLQGGDAGPWRDALFFETRVDGRVWDASHNLLSSYAPGASWEGRGVDRIFAVCRFEGLFPGEPQPPPGSAGDLGEGMHTVQMFATLPGWSTMLSTETKTVSLWCPPTLPGDPPPMPVEYDGCSSSSGGAAPWVVLVALALVTRRRRAALVGLVGTIVLVAATRPADACSPPICSPGQFVPGNGATAPANLPAIYWRASPNAPPTMVSPSNVTLTTMADPSTPLSFTATELVSSYVYLLVPDAPLVAGTSYVLTDSTPCQFGGNTTTTVTFTAGPSAPLPTTLGTLAVTELPARTETVASGGGSCSVEIVLSSAAVSVDTVASELTPWRDVLHFETRVDGQVWNGRSSIVQAVPPGASWVGRGFDRIYAACSMDEFGGSASYALPEGTHQVEMRATLPGTNIALATEPRPATLMCPPPPDGDAGTGIDSGSGEMGEGGGGCCSTTSSTSPTSSTWLALGVVGLLARRRRHRTC